MKRLLFFLPLLLLLACSSENDKTAIFPINQEILGLASPIQLLPESTEIYLEDYFLNPDKIDSVSFPIGINIKSRENNILNISGAISTPLALAKFHLGDTTLAIPMKANTKIVQQFSIPLDATIEMVQLKGSFNGWNPKASEMTYEGESWVYSQSLFPGEYQYLVVINGKEMLDPFNNDSVKNNTGGFNSRIVVGQPNAQKPYVYADSIIEKGFSARVDMPFDKVVALWDNFELDQNLVSQKGQNIQVQIPTEAKKLERSFIRLWVSNGDQLSNDLLIPIEFGEIITDASKLNRTDKHAYRMYFLMVDRFFNGNSENDKPVDDPSIKTLANYLGGDIEGVQKKIESGFFDSLNINTVWLSPIGQNPEGAWGLWDKGGVTSKFSGYHGYWPAKSKVVDYRFGTAENLTSLIETAHKNEQNILLDYVANHVHKVHPVYQQHPEWATELELPDGTLNTEKWDEYRLTTWFDTFLPTLDLENPEVYKAMSDSALFWFENFDIDGFRHDATKHIPEVFWRELTQKLKKKVMLPQSRSIYQIGETYGNAELIGSYVSSGQMDAQFDFNVYDKAISVLGNEDNRMMDLAATLKESLTFYGYHNLMGYISGNQDKPRFISLADGSVDPSEDTKLAGWTREITNQGQIGYDRLAQLHAFNFTIPGIPVIYYGDEIGMPGGNDPDNRRQLPFDNLDSAQIALKAQVAKLAELRKNNMALIYGDIRILEADEYTLMFERRYFDQRVVVMINNVSRPKSMMAPNAEGMHVNFGSKNTSGNGFAVVTVKPHGFEILTK